MANSKLLKEAIADAKAVRETAIANAKLALEEAFTPRLQSILSKKIQAEMEEEDDEVMGEEDEVEVDDVVDVDTTADVDTDEMEMEESEDEMEFEFEDDVVSEDEVDGVGYDDPTNADDASLEEDEMEYDEDEMDLEEIIRELESELDSEDEEVYEEEDETFDDGETFDDVSEDEELDIELVDDENEMTEEEDEMESDEDDFSDEIDLDEILREMGYGDDEEEVHEEEEEMPVDNSAELEAELEEAYSTIKSLRKTINEVNLLNAKLLYTNKLFRSYNLTNEQKVKVVENLDRTSSVREVKLVYATLSESMNFSGTERKGKKSITEGFASKPAKSTAPKREIISEANQMADRFKQLAGLINK
jgi:hypothetical protein